MVGRHQALLVFPHIGDAFDFDDQVLVGEPVDAHGGACRAGIGQIVQTYAGHVLPKEPEILALALELVVGVELDQVLQIRTALTQRALDEAEDVSDLLFDVIGRHGAPPVIRGDLPTDENQVVHLPALGEGDRNAPVPVIGGHEPLLLPADNGDGFDLDEQALVGEAPNTDGRPHRAGIGQVFLPDLGHLFPEAGDVGAFPLVLVVGVELHDVGEIAAGLLQDPFDELEGVSRLHRDVASPDGSAPGIGGNLTADEDHVVDPPPLREGHGHAPIPMIPGHQSCLGHGSVSSWLMAIRRDASSYRAPARTSRVFGSSASRRLSPSRLKPVTMRKIATPGRVETWGAMCRTVRPSLVMMPHSGVGG